MALTASVVIPTLDGANVPNVLARLRDSETQLEAVVADNGVPGEIARAIDRAGADVVQMPRNVGFGAAVNRVVPRTRGDVVLVLNDDVLPRPGFVDSLVGALGGGAEMAAAVLVGSDAPDAPIECAGFELDRALAPHDYLRAADPTTLDASCAPPVGPCGAAAAYLRGAFVEAGGFDEAFFAYYEDVDLALRMRAAGGTCALAHDAVGVHTGSSTLGYDSLRKAEVVGYSRAYFLRKWSRADPPTAARALALEVGAAAFLVGRHRSLAPAAARLRGWRACTVQAPGVPPATVGALAGARRRYERKRSRRSPT